MSTPVLSCVDLCKSYRRGRPVLDKFNISLPSGKIYGLLGPNGCGKSTLIKLICGLLSPDSGRIYVCGEEQSEKTNAYISYLPERTYFDNWMTVEELIGYFSELIGGETVVKSKPEPDIFLKALGNEQKENAIILQSQLLFS